LHEAKVLRVGNIFWRGLFDLTRLWR
jgi:hypothetical protein